VKFATLLFYTGKIKNKQITVFIPFLKTFGKVQLSDIRWILYDSNISDLDKQFSSH
jgi:hypothetical protein